MNNSQQYQPLSAALMSNQPSQPRTFTWQEPTTSNPARNRGDAADDDEDDDDGHEDGQNGSTNMQNSFNSASGAQSVPQHPEKRRPGRPRGSKNRPKEMREQQATIAVQSRPSQTPASSLPQFGGQGTHPNQQQYYEFQWRVLNLCAEFYGAAEELLNGTPPLVLHQCYQMGPGNPIDPLDMLNQAKRVCDHMLANPTQLTSSPPPPMYPQVPQFRSQTTVSGPSSFAVPLNAQPPTFTAFPSGSTPTNTLSYPNYYPPSFSTQTTYQAASTSQAAAQSSTPSTNQGAWNEEEAERLKKLAEESRAHGNGEYNWDWVSEQWGPSRSRSQILIKSTLMGLRDTLTRPNKRPREGDDEQSDSSTNPGTSASPVQQPARPASTSTNKNPPWPMPTVASNSSATGRFSFPSSGR